MKKISVSISLALGIGLAGCAATPRYNVGINSFLNPQSRPISKYILAPGLKDSDPNDLQFQELAGFLQRAFLKKGMTRVNNIDDADAVIFVVYGMGEPQTHSYSYSIPTFGQTSGGVTNYSGSTYGSGGTSYTQGTAYQQPTYGVTGQISGSGEYTTYSRYLYLTAKDLDHFRKTKEEIELWNTRIVSVGSSGDLRKILPVLVAGAEDLIGTDTGEVVQVTLQLSDPKIEEIRGRKTR